MGVIMSHPDLPGVEYEVIDPRGVAIHRQSGWRTANENPAPVNAPDPDNNALPADDADDAGTKE